MTTSGDQVTGAESARRGRSGGPFRGAARLLTTARNVAEVVRFGGLRIDEEASPFVAVTEQAIYRLRHYFADESGASAGRPVLLIPPLMLTAEVWDVSAATSAVATLHRAGLDPWVVDFGDPEREPGGRDRTLTDHVLAVSDAVDRVHEATGRDVVLGGYSQGGMFAYQAAALRRGKHLDSLITFGSPVDTTAPLPIPVTPERAARLAGELVDSGLLRHVTLPRWAARLGFNLLDPVKSVRGRVQFLLALHDRDALLPRERQRRFLESEGWTGYSGPAISELLEQFVAHNRMLEGGFVIDDRLVTLADIELPVLSVVGSTDTIGHPDAVRAISRAAPRAEVYELTLPTGHFGLVVGSAATANTWPAVVGWCRWRDGRGELPEKIVPAEQIESSSPRPSMVTAALTQATELGLDVAKVALTTTRRAVRATQDAMSEAPALLPRLNRLGRLDPATRISLGLLLDEQAAKDAHDVCFLFGDRAYRQREVKYRVDSVVRGLISAGVRHGDRVGVLMDTRPSAFTTIAALSRIGATAVLLRPDGSPAQEADLAGIGWVIADPEHAGKITGFAGVRRAVLGGGTAPRELPAGVIDLERIDPTQVELPAWYRPNPHRAADVAFIVFTGDGPALNAVRITNRRWAISALGTASAAALRPGDTVYSVAPHHHSSALLMSVGGAVAGGARFAMAGASDPDTFWAEVRRYGATHVSYTWTSLRAITLAPPSPSERHHPIRMFLGSGMPANLWRRVVTRFPGIRVLEFYASADAEATLANITGSPIGSLGRPLPGTPPVRVVAYDMHTRNLRLGADGLARECDVDEVGLLLARVNAEDAPASQPLRGLFEPDDAWHSTGDLFRRDEQGRLWLVDSVSALIDTAHGPVAPGIARRAIEAIPAVDVSVAYGVPHRRAEVLVVAVTLLPNAELTGDQLDRACERLPPPYRPEYVQAVPAIPMTTWCRPQWQQLRAAGVPKPGEGTHVWRLGKAGYRSVPLG